MKKRIGNDISFAWHIYRKDGDAQVPEDFTGKEVEVRLISPLQRPATIDDVSIATGVVTFTFRGKHQVTLGNYVAVLLENKGENGMVTLDVVNAVTLVPHSYMEEDGDDGDVIEAEAVELTSTISAGGVIVQQQADWAQTDDTAVDFIKNKPDMGVFCRKDMANVHTSGYDRYRHEYEQVDAETTIQGDGISSCNYNKDGSLREMTNFIPGTITLIKDGVTLSLSYRYFANLVASIQAKADVADLASLVNTGTYNSTSKKIELKHDNNVLAEIDATAFIKDGMVSSVTINNGYLVITFNTDAGKEPISIALTDIFNPANYYTKSQVDNALSDKLDNSGNNYGVYNGVLKISGLQDQDGIEYIRNGMHLLRGLEIYYYDYKTTITGEDIVVHSKDEPEDGSVSLRALSREVDGKADTSDLSEVATSGSYNDLTDKPAIPDVTTKADKVSNATNGNFAALDSNGNLIDSGHKHSDYLTQHQDLTNYVQKSQTAGLLKNDGTVDTNTYLTQHQDISGKADKSEMSVVPGTGADADKTTITLKQGTSATVLTAHQDISGKEDVTNIVTPVNATDATLPITTLTCEVGKYYRIDVAVDTLAIALPAINSTVVKTIVIYLTGGTTPAITISSSDSKDVYYQDGFEIEAGNVYEINALFNGAAWIVASVKINVE